MKIKIFETQTHLHKSAAHFFEGLARKSIKTKGFFSVALMGGNTACGLYSQLALRCHKSNIDWNAVHLFWSDERCVPPNHKDSYFKILSDTLLVHCSIPNENIHRIRGEMTPQYAAKFYEKELHIFFGENISFDLVLLGLGYDGHTASILPNSNALDENIKWCIDVKPISSKSELTVSRVTLTPRAINLAQNIVFLVSGEGKSGILAEVLQSPVDKDRYPAQTISPSQGELIWMVDKDAARLLTRSIG